MLYKNKEYDLPNGRVNIRMLVVKKSVLKTTVYYDCLDYPLTQEELEVFSFEDGDEQEIGYLIEEAQGFYFLKGRKNLIGVRKEKNKIAKKKWQKALKAIRWLRLVPYIKLVFASGSLALSNTDKESDLDVLLVAKHGRIWLTRFLTVLLLGFLGMRRKRHQRVAPDKICLNHFITDESLYIPRKSIYTAQLYAHLVPILVDDKKLIDEFCEANKWVGEYVAGWPECVLTNSKRRIANNRFLKLIRKIGEKILDTKFGDWVESTLKKYQLRRINSYHLTYKPGGRVKADDESLEFHPDSPELKIIENYNKKMIEFGFPELGKEVDSGLLHNGLA